MSYKLNFAQLLLILLLGPFLFFSNPANLNYFAPTLFIYFQFHMFFITNYVFPIQIYQIPLGKYILNFKAPLFANFS